MLKPIHLSKFDPLKLYKKRLVVKWYKARVTSTSYEMKAKSTS